MSEKVMKIGSATVTVIRPDLTEREQEAAERYVREGLERFERMRRDEAGRMIRRETKKEASE